MNPTHGIAIAKGAERYVFLFAADQRSEVLRVAGRWASCRSPESAGSHARRQRMEATGVRENMGVDQWPRLLVSKPLGVGGQF